MCLQLYNWWFNTCSEIGVLASPCSDRAISWGVPGLVRWEGQVLTSAGAASRAGASRKVLIVSLVSPSCPALQWPGFPLGQEQPFPGQGSFLGCAKIPISIGMGPALSQIPSMCWGELLPGTGSCGSYGSIPVFLSVLCVDPQPLNGSVSMEVWHKESGSLFPPWIPGWEALARGMAQVRGWNPSPFERGWQCQTFPHNPNFQVGNCSCFSLHSALGRVKGEQNSTWAESCV